MTVKYLTYINILLLISLIINTLVFLGFWSGNLKFHRALSAETLEPIERGIAIATDRQIETEGEFVFNRFAVSIEKNQNELKSFFIADTFLEDMLLLGLSTAKNYHIAIYYGTNKSVSFILNKEPPYRVKEAWYTYSSKTKKDLNMDGYFNERFDIEEPKIEIKINNKWVPVQLEYGSRFKRKTVDGLIYQFDHNDGVWTKEAELEKSQ